MKRTRSTIGKSGWIICLWLLVVVIAIPISASAAAQDDKYGKWIGNYDGVSYRYGYSYIGNNTWSQNENFVQFWNSNSHQVKVTYYNTRAGRTYGPLVQYLNPKLGPKVSIADGERVTSINVE